MSPVVFLDLFSLILLKEAQELISGLTVISRYVLSKMLMLLEMEEIWIGQDIQIFQNKNSTCAVWKQKNCDFTESIDSCIVHIKGKGSQFDGTCPVCQRFQ